MIILKGRYVIKETRVFAGWLWKDRWVSLTSQVLVIHCRASEVRSPSPLPALFIPLTCFPPSIL